MTSLPPKRPTSGGIGVLAVGAVAALVWTVMFFLVLPRADTGALTLVTGFALPVLLICLATALARALRQLQGEVDRLQAERDALRSAMASAQPDDTPPAQAMPPQSRPAQPVAPAAAPAQAPAPAPNPQRSLPLERPVTDPLSLPDLIRALHFPETEDDTEGFRALAKALKDPQAKPVVRAAQDMLTLLSKDGIYLDDMSAPLPAPDAWRAFAEGARHDAGIGMDVFEDTAALEKCQAQLQGSTVYRDTAHHFLRRFDQLVTAEIPHLDEPAITALTATRSARAFLLIGAAAGMFRPG